jgi:hypothetical protein
LQLQFPGYQSSPHRRLHSPIESLQDLTLCQQHSGGMLCTAKQAFQSGRTGRTVILRTRVIPPA